MWKVFPYALRPCIVCLGYFQQLFQKIYFNIGKNGHAVQRLCPEKYHVQKPCLELEKSTEPQRPLFIYSPRLRVKIEKLFVGRHEIVPPKHLRPWISPEVKKEYIGNFDVQYGCFAHSDQKWTKSLLHFRRFSHEKKILTERDLSGKSDFS